MALEVQVTFDTADPGVVAEFWAAALGYQLATPPAPFTSWDEALEAWHVPPDQRNNASAVVDPDGRGPRLFFQKVPEGKQFKNRVHLDVRAAPGLVGDDRWTALEAAAVRLTALGASVLARVDADNVNAGHIVMADPEGNEFCLD
jgi:hypothetical protein